MNKILLTSLIIIYPLLTNASDHPGNHNPLLATGIFSLIPLEPFHQADIKDYGEHQRDTYKKDEEMGQR